jgi:hypothetical protein
VRDLYYDGIHVNEKGSRETARVVADFLIAQKVLEGPVGAKPVGP